MNNEILINKIYSSTVNSLLNGVEEVYKKELALAYADYLNKTYSNYDVSGKNVDKISNIFSGLEISKWQNASLSSKLSELLKDEALENIRYISNTGFKYAKTRLEQRDPSNFEMTLPAVLDEKVAEENILMLRQLFTKVRSFNIKLAETFISEGILDYKFACGKTDNMSMRVGRMIR